MNQTPMPTAAPSVWSLIYHLSGLTSLGPTPQQPLGVLPAPVRNAVLRAAHELDPQAVEVETRAHELLFGEGQFVSVPRWRFLHGRLTEKRDRDRLAAPRVFEDLMAYVRHFDLGKPESGPDEHFAERVFLEEVFVPVFGVAGLSYLDAQEGFEGSGGRARRIDFVLRGVQRYAIEVEGARYHAREHIGPERFDDEKERQRDLARMGYQYRPMSFNDLRSGRAEAVLNELALEDVVLARLWRAQDQADPRPLAALSAASTLLDGVAAEFRGAQLGLLGLLAEHAGGALHLVDHAPRTPTHALALLDLIGAAERVAALYGLPLRLPRVHLTVHRPQDEAAYRATLALYLGDALDPNAARPDPLRTHVDLEFSDETRFPADATHILAARTVTAPGQVLLPADLTRLGQRFLMQHGAAPLDANPVHVERDLLDYFARRFFGVPELKPEQVKLIGRALRLESGLALLPTGFGKSLVFQLFAMLVPRTTLVISPLKALIRDQVHSLHRQGLVSVEAISSSDSKAAKDRKMEGFRTHAYRLLYISPERLQIKAFADELHDSMRRTPVGALVIDEAHCVSEWGHDFRPAYLQIGRLRELLQGGSGRRVPILGLTATASEPVRRDVLAVLGLPPESVEQLASSDRPNISLSVHPLGAGNGHNKPDLLERMLREVVPKALSLSFHELFTPGAKGYPHAGVVFALYADPHGKTTLKEGVHAVARSLHRRLFNSLQAVDAVQVHASTPPKYCPQCGSTMFVGASAKELAAAGVAGRYGSHCQDCGHVFVRSQTDNDWDDKLLATQDGFQADAFPLLVATKGYGMGIDKRNIRFIVHHALSSGMEGYYQEAGRAGRDGQHAHAALVFHPPTPQCYADHLSHDREPPCISEARNFQFHKCPYDTAGLCDYGRQARFVKESYPGADQDAEGVLAVFEQLRSAGGREAVLEAEDEDAIKHTQLALYRLQQLGLVLGYTLAYVTLRRVRLHAEINPAWTAQSVVDQLDTYLRQHSQLAPQERAKRLQGVMPAELAADGTKRRRADGGVSAPDEVVRRALHVLVGEVYRTVPKMRYQMLTNELHYTMNPDGVCRRVRIRAIFDSVDHLPDDYNCGFCDVCVPDLQFGRSAAQVPVRDAQIDEIARRLPQVMDGFEPAALQDIVTLADQHGATVGLGARVTHRLEHDPTNLSALYLAGRLTAKQAGRDGAALRHLGFGLEEAQRRGEDTPTQRLFFDAAKTLDADTAFSWVAQVGGPNDTPEGLAWLEAEAAEVYGEQSDQRRTVRSLRQVRQLDEVHDLLQADLLGPLQELNALLEMSA